MHAFPDPAPATESRHSSANRLDIPLSVHIDTITPADATADLIERLAELLVDVVHRGASIGFLAPLSNDTARSYWRSVMDALGSELHLWVARADDRIVGTVQLAPCPKQNGRHRADVQKLMVHGEHRGARIASALMDALETRARALERSLLVLDTEAGSGAESFYRGLGWIRAGEIPNYAANPAGRLHPTAYYYKLL